MGCHNILRRGVGSMRAVLLEYTSIRVGGSFDSCPNILLRVRSLTAVLQ